jgi:hypothetical protein
MRAPACRLAISVARHALAWNTTRCSRVNETVMLSGPVAAPLPRHPVAPVTVKLTLSAEQ